MASVLKCLRLLCAHHVTLHYSIQGLSFYVFPQHSRSSCLNQLSLILTPNKISLCFCSWGKRRFLVVQHHIFSSSPTPCHIKINIYIKKYKLCKHCYNHKGFLQCFPVEKPTKPTTFIIKLSAFYLTKNVTFRVKERMCYFIMPKQHI